MIRYARTSIIVLLAVLVAACSSTVRIDPPPSKAVLTVEVIGPAPGASWVTVGDREWQTRPETGTIVEEFTPGLALTVFARADGYVTSEPQAIRTRSGQMAPVRITLERVSAPPITVSWPALCASYYTSLTDPDLDLPQFAAWLQSMGATCTRVWTLDAWALGEKDGTGKFLPGQYAGRIPVVRLADGRWDLNEWNDAYFSHLRTYVETMNRHGVFPHLTILELYTWSEAKSRLPFVPTRDAQPWRNNVNGVRWGNPDDRSFGAEQFEGDPAALPDAWLKAFICKMVTTLDGTAWEPEVGNEMPEKAMHGRIGLALVNCGWTGGITVNRNEDTPGQVFNMRIGQPFDSNQYPGVTFTRLALHGKLDMGYLDEDFPEEAGAGRPRTFRDMWPLVDPARIILSSDGGGGNPVHLPALKDVACDVLKRGGSYEHQLALKRNRFFGDGTLRMADLEIDRAFLLSLAECRPATEQTR